MSSPTFPMSDVFGGPIQISGGYVVKRYVGGVAGMLAGLAVAAGFIGLEVGELQDLQRDTALWEDPAAGHATEVSAGGEFKSNLMVLYEYKLDVQYTDEAGVQHTGKVEFSTVPELEHMGAPAMVHYDKADPQRFALSYAVKERNKRLASIFSLMLVGALLLGGSLFILGFVALRNARIFQRVARGGSVVLCELVKVTEIRQYGRVVSVHHQYRVPAGPLPQPFLKNQAFPAKGAGPLRVKDKLVGVWSAENPKGVMLLNADFSPLVLTPEQQAQARERLETAAA